jgi:hypothetical protein
MVNPCRRIGVGYVKGKQIDTENQYHIFSHN